MIALFLGLFRLGLCAIDLTSRLDTKHETDVCVGWEGYEDSLSLGLGWLSMGQCGDT